MRHTINLPDPLVAQIEPVIEERRASLDDFVREAITVYLRIIARRKSQAQVERDYDALASMYEELAAELADETWGPLENKALTDFERGLENG
ncbi:MAG: hypothetical protein FJ272_14225 [Planctomycetes bacterium]|nr:hypothetical protein [Planctomycetota bacterium]MBM4085938.1 hypothetical protein [Planctomycetota bacterium]